MKRSKFTPEQVSRILKEFDQGKSCFFLQAISTLIINLYTLKVAHLRQIVTLDKNIVVAQFARNLPETAPLRMAQFVQNHWLTLVQNGWLTLVQIIQFLKRGFCLFFNPQSSAFATRMLEKYISNVLLQKRYNRRFYSSSFQMRLIRGVGKETALMQAEALARFSGAYNFLDSTGQAQACRF